MRESVDWKKRKHFSLRVRETITSWNSRPDLGQIGSIWGSKTTGVARPTLRILRVKIDPRWPEGGMRKGEVIISLALSFQSIFLNDWDKKPTLHITPYPLTDSNHSLLDKNHRETYPLPSAIQHHGGHTNFLWRRSFRASFAKDTCLFQENPPRRWAACKTTKDKMFFHKSSAGYPSACWGEECANVIR